MNSTERHCWLRILSGNLGNYGSEIALINATEIPNVGDDLKINDTVFVVKDRRWEINTLAGDPEWLSCTIWVDNGTFN